MNFKTAKEYIEYLDEQYGESWSNATEKLSDVMEDYAKIYHERQLKLLGIANVVGRSEQLLAFCEWLSERDFTCNMTSPEDWVEMYLKSK
jgi:hypothetical protein